MGLSELFQGLVKSSRLELAFRVEHGVQHALFCRVEDPGCHGVFALLLVMIEVADHQRRCVEGCLEGAEVLHRRLPLTVILVLELTLELLLEAIDDLVQLLLGDSLDMSLLSDITVALQSRDLQVDERAVAVSEVFACANAPGSSAIIS